MVFIIKQILILFSNLSRTFIKMLFIDTKRNVDNRIIVFRYFDPL